MNETIINRIRKIQNDLLYKSDGKFADDIGVTRSNFAQMMLGKRPIGDGVLNKICIRMNVNKDWLMYRHVLLTEMEQEFAIIAAKYNLDPDTVELICVEYLRVKNNHYYRLFTEFYTVKDTTTQKWDASFMTTSELIESIAELYNQKITTTGTILSDFKAVERMVMSEK